MREHGNFNWLVHIILAVVIAFGVPCLMYGAYTLGKKSYKPTPTTVADVIDKKPFDNVVVSIPVYMKFTPEGGGYKYIPVHGVKVTAYNNLPEQTNEQPNIGASNRKVFEGSVAVSRDILRDYKVKYGDILCLELRNKCYFIEDTMNKRYDGENGKRVDIFMYSKSKAFTVNHYDNAVIFQQL